MKTRIFIVLAVLLAISAAAHTAPEGGKWMFTPNIAATYVSKGDDGGKYNGVGINGTLEKVISSGKFALGFNLGHIWIIGEAPEDEPEARDPLYSSVPVYVTFKYFAVGNDRATGYFGAGAGIQVSHRDWKNESDRKIGAAFGIPVGVQIWTNSDLYFNLNYTFNYLNDSWYTDDIVHMFNFGVGFQF